MQLIKSENYVGIISDQNVTSHATADYMSADMSQYNTAAPTFAELRQIYEKAQRIFFELRAKGVIVPECQAARDEMANVYKKYKRALLERLENERRRL